jgi:APA family basic amino acid/polyamine antiporter
LHGAATSIRCSRGSGIHLPGWLTHGYRTALLSANPEIHALLQTAPRIAGVPILLNVPAFLIVAFVTGLLVYGVKESIRANNIMVLIKLLVLGLFVVVGVQHIDPANYVPFAPNGWTGIHQGAAIVFFAYIGFDAISTAAEETKDPQKNMPIGIIGGLAICTLIYVIVGWVATGIVPYQELRAADPLAQALKVAGLTRVSWIVSAGAGGGAHRGAAGVPVRTAAHLHGDGPRRPPAAVGREDPPEVPHARHQHARHRLHCRTRRTDRR